MFVFVTALVLSFLVFGNGIFGDFVFDDVSVVQNRGDLKDISNLPNLFVSPYHHLTKIGLYRPFTMASYAINHYINSLVFGEQGRVSSFKLAAGFHIVNIVIHALNSFLVFWLINYLFKNKFLSLSTFLLFLTHPIHTEAVTSIVGRAELLAFFWSLVTVYLFIKRDTLLSSIAFLFAMFSKEVALMVLPIIFYVDLMWRQENPSRTKQNVPVLHGIDWPLIKNRLFSTTKRMLFFVLPFGVYSLLRYKALGIYFLGDVTTTIVENPLKFLPFSERILTAFKVLYLYLEKLIWPIHLSADYSYNAIPSVSNFWELTWFIGAGFFILLIGLLLYRKTNKTELAFGSLVFLAPYLMISNLVKPVGTIMGERLMYFPSLGFVLLLASLLERLFSSFRGRTLDPRTSDPRFQGSTLNLKKGRTLIVVALAVILSFYSVRTAYRNKDWRDARTLFLATVKESPNSLISRMALAAVHIKDDEWEEAKRELNIARNIYEENSRVQNLLGIIADHEGDFKLAEEKYKKSLELNPDAVNADINLAELYLKEDRLEEAGASFKKVIDFYPVTEYVIRYAYIQIATHDPDGAIDTISKYLSNDLNHPDLSALTGTAYFVKGDYKQALFFLRKARELGNKASEIEEMIKIAEQES